LNNIRFTQRSSTTINKNSKDGLYFNADDIYQAQALIKKLKVSAKVKNTGLKIITSTYLSPNIKYKFDQETNDPRCVLCGFQSANTAHLFGRCVFALLIKTIYTRAYAIEYGINMKLEARLTYLGSLSRKDFSKTHQINLASLVHLANYTIHLANSNKFLINSLTDFFSLIQKTAKRASIFWHSKFPSALLDINKITELAPHCEVTEINALPLHRFYHPKPLGIQRSKCM
jgi:hypothetical protein